MDNRAAGRIDIICRVGKAGAKPSRGGELHVGSLYVPIKHRAASLAPFRPFASLTGRHFAARKPGVVGYQSVMRAEPRQRPARRIGSDQSQAPVTIVFCAAWFLPSADSARATGSDYFFPADRSMTEGTRNVSTVIEHWSRFRVGGPFVTGACSCSIAVFC